MSAHCAGGPRPLDTIRLRRIFGIGDASPRCRRRLGLASRAQARGGSLLLTFQIGGRGSRHRRPLPDRPPTLQAFRSVLSETTSVSTRRLIKDSRSYLRRHGVQSRRAAISYHKLTLSVYRKFCRARKACRRTGQSPIPTPLRSLRSLRRKELKRATTSSCVESDRLAFFRQGRHQRIDDRVY